MTDTQVRGPSLPSLDDQERAARALGLDGVVHASVYGSAAFAAEQERIFASVWSFCCHESEVAETGAFVTLSVAGSPILVNRDRDGALRAFYNTCRHRGSRVVSAECGVARSFQCPYHHWTYGLDGSLRAVPGEEAYACRAFDRADFGLVPIPVDSVGGLVFCSLDDSVVPLREFLGDEVVRLIEGLLGRGEFEVFEQRSLEHGVNWKLWPENWRDGYHVPFVHQRSLGPISPAGEYHILGNGHAQQKLRATQAYLSDEVWGQLMSDPLPGVEPDEAWNLALFPDTLLFLRGNAFFVERQEKIAPQQTALHCRVLGLVGDSEEQHRNRRLSWQIWYEGPVSTEDYPVIGEQQIGITTAGPQYSLIARGLEATTGLRGDDNRLRTFWAAWRQWMGTDENRWPPEVAPAAGRRG